MPNRMQELLLQYEKVKKELKDILDTPSKTYTPRWVPADFEDLETDILGKVKEIQNLF